MLDGNPGNRCALRMMASMWMMLMWCIPWRVDSGSTTHKLVVGSGSSLVENHLMRAHGYSVSLCENLKKR